VERAEKLRGPASFWRRVAEQAERIIDKLEIKDPESICELDSLAEVLVKTEKVGAREYRIEWYTRGKATQTSAARSQKAPDRPVAARTAC